MITDQNNLPPDSNKKKSLVAKLQVHCSIALLKMAFRCIRGCKTATGRDRTFQNVGNCTNHYKDVHQIDMTEEQALKHCLVGSKASMKLKPFQPDDGSVPMVVVPAAAAVPNDLASVAVSSMGSLGLSRMGLDATEQVLLLATLANHRAASAALAAAAAGGGAIEEGDEEGDEDGDEEEEGKSTRSSSRLKIGKKLRKSTK